MISWFKKRKKDYPEFWLDYLEHFKDIKKTPINETRFVAFDTETTGFDRKKDRILSIGAVAFVNKRIPVNQSLELYLEQDIFNPETVKIHEIMKSSDFVKISELEAIKVFLDYIKNAILVAHHANFDKTMMNEMLSRNGLGKLKNKFIDTGVLYNKSKHKIYQENLKEHYYLDDLCEELNVPKVDRHTANGDALITAIVFLKILARLDKRKNLKWSYLLGK
ncbi:3'-5' exonuclease [Algibacter pectinivorans]|uniref:DNA polymerase-3 subunit epsilon n=1 Tax=Algibacter pectinivorans TaxID=870482 RepID=A0A1I1QTA3_9FLAO|nr:3'-5' exonuclease [Algibacter pectinivorans]SFD25341.1 DNA polymerase-3 subunit epsilon [Algibacter pectinivorans]